MPGITLLLQIIPLAIGAAISPGVLTVQILVLSSGPGSLPRAWGLALGRMTTLLLIGLAGVSLLVQLPDFGTGRPSAIEAAILGVAGLVLLAVAVIESRRPPHRSSRPSFAGKVVEANPISLFVFGAGWMLVNASTLALYIPGLHVITNSPASFAMHTLAFLILFFGASAVVLLPALGVTFFGDRARPVLADIHDWVDRYSHRITIWVCGVFGVGLVAVAGSVFVSV